MAENNKSGIINVIVGAKVTDFIAKMSLVSKTTRKTKDTTMQNMKLMAKSFAFSFGAISVAAAKMSSDFSREMTKIETLVGISRKEVDKMRKDVLAMSKEVGRSPQELAEGLYFVTSAGLRGAEAMEALKLSSQAAALGLGETKDIADAVTSIMNAYGSEVYSASDATNLLLKTVKLGKLEASSLAGSIGQVIPMASTLGVSMEELGANIATVTRIGLSAEETMTTLKGLLNALAAPSKDATDALAELGMTSEDLRQMIRNQGLLNTLLYLQDAFNGNFDKISRLIPNIRALTNFLATAGTQADTYTQNMKGMSDGVDDVAVGMDRLSEEAGFRWDKMTARLTATMIQYGDAVAGAAISMQDLAQAERDFHKEFKRRIDLAKENNKNSTLPSPTTGANPFAYTMGASAPFVYTPPSKTTTTTTGGGGGGMTAEQMDAVKKANEEVLRAIENARIWVEEYEKGMKSLGNYAKNQIKVTKEATGHLITEAEVAEDLKKKFGELNQAGLTFNETLVKISNTIQKVAATIVDKFGKAMEFAMNSISRIQSVLNQAHNNELNNLTAKEKAEMDALRARSEGSQNYAALVADLEEKQEQRRKKIQEEQAQRAKQLATFQAILAGVLAVIHAYADPGNGNFLTRSAIAATVAGITAAEVAVINGASVPSFAMGGMMPYTGVARVGEMGPENVVLPAGAQVIPNRMSGGGSYSMSIDRERFTIWSNEGDRHHSFRNAYLR